MKQTGNANTAFGWPDKQGFSLRELLILISCLIVMVFVIFPNQWVLWGRICRRGNCLSNVNGLWKAASSWGFDPIQTWRPTFPETNLASALANDNAGITPELFICPEAYGRTRSWGICIAREEYSIDTFRAGKNKSWGIYAATNLAAIREYNCNYAFFGGRHDTDGSLVLIADKNGSNNLPSATSWGGNHDGKGGNVIKVAGQGFWVSTPAQTNFSVYCITNAEIMAAFTNTGPVYSY